MKKGFTLVTLICLVVVAVLSISCSKSDDPADNDLFVGKYHGTISYTVDHKPKIVDNGTVTVIILFFQMESQTLKMLNSKNKEITLW